jgi:hypothetical protein
MTPAQTVEIVVFLAGIGLVAWQFRWLLRAYRTERERQASERRSSRAFVLVLALTVFVALASMTDLYTARRIAVGGILVVALVEAARRRWGKVN